VNVLGLGQAHDAKRQNGAGEKEGGSFHFLKAKKELPRLVNRQPNAIGKNFLALGRPPLLGAFQSGAENRTPRRWRKKESRSRGPTPLSGVQGRLSSAQSRANGAQGRLFSGNYSRFFGQWE
jgi:hypothetical protein